MFSPTVQRKESNVIVIKIDHNKVARGHRSHLSGSGKHDSRPQRLRTRSAQRRAALAD